MQQEWVQDVANAPQHEEYACDEEDEREGTALLGLGFWRSSIHGNGTIAKIAILGSAVCSTGAGTVDTTRIARSTAVDIRFLAVPDSIRTGRFLARIVTVA